jgi:hypothetical protein
MILNINITTKYRFVTYFFAAGFDPLKGQASLRCWWALEEGCSPPSAPDLFALSPQLLPLLSSA